MNMKAIFWTALVAFGVMFVVGNVTALRAITMPAKPLL